MGTDEIGQLYPVVNYEVSGEKIQVVEMIPGYTHNIVILSDTEDLVTFMWCNECFDPAKPDTYFEPVETGNSKIQQGVLCYREPFPGSTRKRVFACGKLRPVRLEAPVARTASAA